MFNGRPLDIREICESSKAVLEAWMPGTEGGMALMNILSGTHEPTGRLPMSFPYCVGQVPIHYDSFPTGRFYDEKQKENRFLSKYLDIPNKPLFPFGWGLGYTDYSISDVRLDKKNYQKRKDRCRSNRKKYRGQNRNRNNQLYIHDVAASVVRPVKQLKGYKESLCSLEKKP